MKRFWTTQTILVLGMVYEIVVFYGHLSTLVIFLLAMPVGALAHLLRGWEKS